MLVNDPQIYYNHIDLTTHSIENKTVIVFTKNGNWIHEYLIPEWQYVLESGLVIVYVFISCCRISDRVFNGPRRVRKYFPQFCSGNSDRFPPGRVFIGVVLCRCKSRKNTHTRLFVGHVFLSPAQCHTHFS